jgi:hypothetical protein
VRRITNPSQGRATIRTKSSRPSAVAPTASTSTSTGASSRNPKKSQRLARHADLISRIERKAASSKVVKRRRPKTSTALLGSIDSLAAALPEAALGGEGKEGAMGERKGGMASKAIKSRPGAMVRKERLLRSECERFGKNLAILEAEKGGKEEEEGAVRGTWATLRNFIGATLEKKEEFVEMEKKAAEKAAGATAMEVEN